MTNNFLRISILFAFIIFFQVGNAVQAKNAGTEVKASFSNNTNNLVDELEDYVGRYRIERTDFEYATVTFENGKLYGRLKVRSVLSWYLRIRKDIFMFHLWM